jgi:hypothetical protein
MTGSSQRRRPLPNEVDISKIPDELFMRIAGAIRDLAALRNVRAAEIKVLHTVANTITVEQTTEQGDIDQVVIHWPGNP